MKITIRSDVLLATLGPRWTKVFRDFIKDSTHGQNLLLKDAEFPDDVSDDLAGVNREGVPIGHAMGDVSGDG